MPKINLKVSLKSDDKENIINVPGIISDNVLKYKEDENTLVKYNYNNELIRENDNLLMKYQFVKGENTTGEIFIKKINQTIKVNIKTKKLERKNNDIEVIFDVEDKEFIYHIEEEK